MQKVIGAQSAPAFGTLSEFLSLLELHGQTWCFAEIGTSGGFSVPPGDDVIFYAMIKGTARIAGVGGDVIELQPGHVAMILSGESHALRNQPESHVRTLEFLREEQSIDIPPTIQIGNGPVTTKILCGRLRVNLPGGLRRMAMPPFVRLGDIGTTSASVRCETLLYQAVGNGAAALLTRTASLMLAIALRNHPQCHLLFRLSATHDPIARAPIDRCGSCGRLDGGWPCQASQYGTVKFCSMLHGEGGTDTDGCYHGAPNAICSKSAPARQIQDRRNKRSGRVPVRGRV
jgi:Cupin